MHPSTTFVAKGPLADADLVALGARSGLLWRSSDVTLVGLGTPDRVDLRLPEAATRANEVLSARSGSTSAGPAGTGPIGFITMPFDPLGAGVMLVPPVVVANVDGRRFVHSDDTHSAEDVERLVRAATEAPDPPSPRRVEVILHRSADAWRDGVVAASRDRIASGAMQKAVLARLLTLQADAPFPVAKIVRDLARRFETAYLFAIDGFIGASPELLVSRFGRTVKAHPLAGTAARSQDADADAGQIAGLLGSSKDRSEHRITIEWLLAELLRYCSYVDAEPEPSVLTLANVHHLGTLVEGVLSEPAASILDLVAAVHPTPAVGGDPQFEALQLIAELEGFDRGRYGGPSGWIDAAGNGEFAVSVRTAQISESTATIAAGVGVVAQSDPDAELAETQAKFRAMLGTFLCL